MTTIQRIQDLIPEDKPHISNSLMSDVKRIVLGQQLFSGGERFLYFGSELHRSILEPETAMDDFHFTDDERLLLDDMYQQGAAHEGIQKALKCAKTERILFADIEGVRVKVILDIHNEIKHFGADLKSTSCTTEKAFLKTCTKYGYWRQAYIYMSVAKLKSFKFFAMSKKGKCPIFEIDVANYPVQMAAAKRETIMLISIIKSAGRFNN